MTKRTRKLEDRIKEVHAISDALIYLSGEAKKLGFHSLATTIRGAVAEASAFSSYEAEIEHPDVDCRYG
jgi:hypothetical protein